jgi:hypothetical protein
MLSLKSFHFVFIAVAIVVTAGFGTWGLFNHYRLLGTLSLALSIALVVYEAYFAARSERLPLE